MEPSASVEAAAAEAPREHDDVIVRHTFGERVLHWLVALAYVLLILSGLALFEPALYWLSYLFGGGNLMRVLHPFIGVALVALFAVYAAREWRNNFLVATDYQWLKKSMLVMRRKIELRVDGKYNAGQKVLYWIMLLLVLGLLVSGLLLWRPYIAPSVPLVWRRLAVVTHALFGFLMFVAIGVHIYAAYWTRGAMRAMTRGYVSQPWARFHYAGWKALEPGRKGDKT